MANNIYAYALRQFYTINEDGVKRDYSKPQMLKFPKRSKSWKELCLILGNEDIKTVGWENIK